MADTKKADMKKNRYKIAVYENMNKGKSYETYR